VNYKVYESYPDVNNNIRILIIIDRGRNMQKEEKLDQILKEGIYGTYEIKKDEKNRFLGEFEERVLCFLKTKQVFESAIYTEVLDAIKYKEASKLIIDHEIDYKYVEKYIKEARENGINFKRVSSPDFKGDIVLLIASDHAVYRKNREIMDRKESLKILGISDNIIKNVGAKLCEDCWRELEDKAPEELINYKKISFMDRLMGVKCIACR